MQRGSRLDELFTLIFMAMAIVAVICYFAVSNRTIFLAIGGVAVVLRLVQYVMRRFG